MPSNSARLPFFTPFEKGAAWPLGTQTGAGLLRQGHRLSRALAVLEITGNPYIRMSAKGPGCVKTLSGYSAWLSCGFV